MRFNVPYQFKRSPLLEWVTPSTAANCATVAATRKALLNLSMNRRTKIHRLAQLGGLFLAMDSVKLRSTVAVVLEAACFKLIINSGSTPRSVNAINSGFSGQSSLETFRPTGIKQLEEEGWLGREVAIYLRKWLCDRFNFESIEPGARSLKTTGSRGPPGRY